MACIILIITIIQVIDVENNPVGVYYVDLSNSLKSSCCYCIYILYQVYICNFNEILEQS